MKRKKRNQKDLFHQPAPAVDEKKLAQCVDILSNAKRDMERIARCRKVHELSKTIRNT